MSTHQAIASGVGTPEPRPIGSEVMVRIEGLSKRFKIYPKPSGRIVEWVTRGRAIRHEDFWALRGIDLQVRRGECVGIIGPNGSGKSTLLKIVTGAMRPTQGAAHVEGRVLSLIELGTGLNPLLTGRQNIHNAARLLAFPPDFAARALPEIEDFAELGAFFDRELRLYSSGMKVRLAFSMFACFRPEIFIVDEALSVGDVFFKQKCAVRMREMLDAGMTMLFVSHDTGSVLGLCHRAMVLHKGEPQFVGDPAEAVSRYTSIMKSDGPQRRSGLPERSAAKGGTGSAREAILAHDVTRERKSQRHGAGGAAVVAARVTDPSLADTTQTDMGGELIFHVLIASTRDVEHPRASIRLYDRHANLIFGGGTHGLGFPLPAMKAGQSMVVRFRLAMAVKPGDYSFGLGVDEPGPDGTGRPLDRLDRLGPITVRRPTGPRAFHGMARLPVSITHDEPG